jgi:hypothetical protein
MNSSPRVLFVAWQCRANRAIYPVARLLVRGESPRYEFAYVHGVRDALRHGFSPFARMRRLDCVYLSDELFPLFGNRVMSPSRPDFLEHLERLGLDAPADPILVLGRSEGRKVTDNLEIFVPPDFDEASGSWVYSAFARGIRHIAGAEEAIRGLRPGDRLAIERDIGNDWDARALLMLGASRARVGFVPHTLVEDLDRVLDLGAPVGALVLRVNPDPAPVQQRLLVQIRAQHVEGFQPLATLRYQALASSSSRESAKPVLPGR